MWFDVEVQIVFFFLVGGRAGESKTLHTSGKNRSLGGTRSTYYADPSRGLKMSCPSPLVIMTGEWGTSATVV